MSGVDNIITSVQQTQPQHVLNPELLTTVRLDLRGRRFTVDRDTLMNLPESILLCLFPNGLVLSRVGGGGTSSGGSQWSDGGEDGEDDYLYAVDFDPDCFHFVINFFHHSRDEFYGSNERPGPFHAQAALVDPSNPIPNDFTGSRNPLLTKQAIIVLREELEYFVIPPAGADGLPVKKFTDDAGIANEEHLGLKRQCGGHLLEMTSIFTALQRNVNKENNIAEQHLIDMLCMSGFDRNDAWGFRAIEPSRCCISSIALVLLKTGISHLDNGEVLVDQVQMGTAQKLLLFWRKPARKCWWDGVEVEVNVGGERKQVKLWARRVWTLELSLVRIQFPLTIVFC
ncbi:hypothetical protein DL93DRAFT_2051819 [Clavulina sp. PMI_390]|nr:hypothetical protein DL93DRAFT_2051819 [Clavulina sp. PMI_390]